MANTNLEQYAKDVSERLWNTGRTDIYHFSELARLIDELIKYIDHEKTAGSADDPQPTSKSSGA